MSTMLNSVSSQASATANRADVNSSRGAAGRNAVGGSNDSERSQVGTKTPTRIETLINVLQMYNDLSPSDQASLSEALQADAASTRSKSNLTFRAEDIKYVTLDTFYDFPRVVLDLAKSKTYFPLTYLTYPGIKRLHAGEDPSTFPLENTISEIDFHQASYKFIDLMSLLASPSIVEWFKTHQSFCLSHMRKFRVVVAFDIETRRRFFNTERVLSEDAYLSRWNALDADMFHKELSERVDQAKAVIENSKSDNRFHPYSKTQPGNGHSLCLICGRTGHKASECSDAYTVKEGAVVCEWNGTLVLKATSEVVCMLFNVGRCDREHERVHVCSICGSQGHGAKSCC
ncbi:hypothetical protein EDD22DRAFT_433705 [Suillus occidentalis]|nr:hypothetical protein EDD22DRAFT_433705 [Suillus occidentalis]